MSDFISRQAAIEAVEHITSSMSVCVNTDECHGMKRMQRQAVIELANLPSAQPEIVRCKECKHHWIHRCMDSMPTEICELDQTFYDANVDFCSLAERRNDGVDS